MNFIWKSSTINLKVKLDKQYKYYGLIIIVIVVVHFFGSWVFDAHLINAYICKDTKRTSIAMKTSEGHLQEYK